MVKGSWEIGVVYTFITRLFEQKSIRNMEILYGDCIHSAFCQLAFYRLITTASAVRQSTPLFRLSLRGPFFSHSTHKLALHIWEYNATVLDVP